MVKDMTKGEMDDVGHTIKMMAELLNTLRKTKLVLSFDAISRLSEADHNELREAIRLLRGFLNNL